jgi:phosphotransferase system HPr (HPr) family protein
MEKIIKVTLKFGLHARPSAYISSRIAQMELDEAVLIYHGRSVKLKSIISLLTAAVDCGEEVFVRVTGKDAEKAMLLVETTLKAENYSEVSGEKKEEK